MYRGVFKGQPVAVKVSKHSQVEQNALRCFQRKLSILYNNSHPQRPNPNSPPNNSHPYARFMRLQKTFAKLGQKQDMCRLLCAACGQLADSLTGRASPAGAELDQAL